MSGAGRPTGAALVAPVAPRAPDDPRLVLQSPMVGRWQPQVRPGRIVQPGELIGVLTVLGVVHPVIAGSGASGAVVKPPSPRREVAVGHGEVIVTLDRTVAETELHVAAASDAPAAGELAIRAPSSGRFYGRPGPGKPAFVAAGDPVRPGQTVGLLEVMKSFHRVTAGDEVPPGARVAAIVVADDADVDAGDELIRLEVAS